MIRVSDQHRCDDDAPAGALATLGLVALLVAFLTRRLSGCDPRCAVTAMAVGRVQVAMALLAVAAWREIEEPRVDALPELEAAALEMRAALLDLFALLATRRAPLRPAGGSARVVRVAPPCVPAPGRGIEPRSRDGPWLRAPPTSR